MEPLEEMLARLAGEPGHQLAGIEQEFTLNPVPVRQALAGLVAQDRLLWVKHLFQWLHDVPQLRAPVLTAPDSSHLLLTMFPSHHDDLTLDRVSEAEAQLLGTSPTSRLARILVELGKTAQFLDARQPGTALSCQPSGFALAPAQAIPGSGIALYFHVRSLLRVPRFGAGQAHALPELGAVVGLHPLAPTLDFAPPFHPDWPLSPPIGEDDDRLNLWDWESVEPSQGDDGFLWSVASWATPLQEGDGSLPVVVRHPLELPRSFSQHPVLGCYPASLASRLDPEPNLSHMPVRVRRVFGVSWTVSAPKNSLLIPVIRGVPGTPLPIEGAPPGFFLLADAGALKTDASGMALVQDPQMLAWQEELLTWGIEQASCYLPYLEQLPTLWLQRSRRWRDQVRPPGKLGRKLKAALFAFPPVHRLLTRRKDEVTAWLTEFR